jgi:hypothetical protein
VRTEWRLRELERIHLPGAAVSGEAGQDTQWLIHQVRRSHHALLQILAASADVDDSQPTLQRIKFLANDVLNMYPPTTES